MIRLGCARLGEPPRVRVRLGCDGWAQLELARCELGGFARCSGFGEGLGRVVPAQPG